MDKSTQKEGVRGEESIDIKDNLARACKGSILHPPGARRHPEHNKITTNHGVNGFTSKVKKCSAGTCVPRICSERGGGGEKAKGRSKTI